MTFLSGFRPPLEIKTVQQPDTFGPFKQQACLIFRWLLYLPSQVMNPTLFPQLRHDCVDQGKPGSTLLPS